MVRFTLVLVAARGSVASIATVLRLSMIQARSERACVRCSLSIDLADPDTLHYVEEWATERDLRDQIRTDRFHTILMVMETAHERPHVTVQLVSRSAGLEYIEDAMRIDRA